MEFIDNVTPSFPDYQSQNRQYWRMWHDSDKDAFMSWAQMYYPNAFQAAMLNYQNEYEKPVNQMLRYQEAGLNPYSFQNQSSASGSQGAAPTPSFGFQEIRNKRMQNFLKGVNDIVQIVGSAKEVYDYMNYGRTKSFNESVISSYNADIAQALALTRQSEADWSAYWNRGNISVDPASGKPINESPRAVYMDNSTQRIANQVEQIAYMVDFLYPSQREANLARAALVDYQKEIEKGRYDAVLSIDTGNKNVDAFLRALCMFFIGSTSMGVGLSHKF